jgi:hypothetical protein
MREVAVLLTSSSLPRVVVPLLPPSLPLPEVEEGDARISLFEIVLCSLTEELSSTLAAEEEGVGRPVDSSTSFDRVDVLLSSETGTREVITLAPVVDSSLLTAPALSVTEDSKTLLVEVVSSGAVVESSTTADEGEGLLSTSLADEATSLLLLLLLLLLSLLDVASGRVALDKEYELSSSLEVEAEAVAKTEEEESIAELEEEAGSLISDPLDVVVALSSALLLLSRLAEEAGVKLEDRSEVELELLLCFASEDDDDVSEEEEDEEALEEDATSEEDVALLEGALLLVCASLTSLLLLLLLSLDDDEEEGLADEEDSSCLVRVRLTELDADADADDAVGLAELELLSLEELELLCLSEEELELSLDELEDASVLTTDEAEEAATPLSGVLLAIACCVLSSSSSFDEVDLALDDEGVRVGTTVIVT